MKEAKEAKERRATRGALNAATTIQKALQKIGIEIDENKRRQIALIISADTMDYDMFDTLTEISLTEDNWISESAKKCLNRLEERYEEHKATIKLSK